jgi:hypothetical protein
MMNAPAHVVNWQVGWWLILLAFVTGAGIGLFFHREDFLGGYNSFRRRIVRLGHIALAALGMLNVIFSFSPWPVPETTAGTIASLGFVVGGIAMPTVCFLTGWRESFRHLFFVPVLALLIAVSFTIGGAP